MIEELRMLQQSVVESLKPLQGKTEEIQDLPPLSFYLVTRSYLVVFSRVSDDLTTDYDRSVAQLKEMYAKRSREWRDLDLCLILCVSRPVPADKDLYHKIEQDPYFCRKFVLDLSIQYPRSLDRLPFVPLSNVGTQSIDGFERPISCQTMLMQKGVPTDLARSLSTPSKMSEHTIVEKCLSREFRIPQLGESNQRVFGTLQSSKGKGIRLKSLKVQGFRAYEGGAEFDLDADLVVLFGPNGSGKTSFFDAIDYCCTGGVGRFDVRYSRSPDRMARVLRNLDSPASFLRLEINRNGTKTVIEKSVGEGGAIVDGQRIERTEVLLALTGYQREENDLRLSNLVNLFRASHLFGQDFRSLTEGLEKESRLPQDIVSRMLAFQDYVEAISKSRKVLDELNKNARGKQNEIGTIERSIDSAVQGIQQLRSYAKKASDPKALRRLRARLLKSVQASLRIDWPKDRELDLDALHEWRTRLAVEANALIEQANATKELETIVQPADVAKDRIAEVTAFVNRSRGALQAAEKASSKKGSEVAALTQRVNSILFELGQVRSQMDNHTWLVRQQPELLRLRLLIEATQKEVEKEANALATIGKPAFDLDGLARTAQRTFETLQGEVHKHEANIIEIDTFLENLSQWGSQEEAVSRAEKYVAGYQANAAELQKQFSVTSGQLDDKTIELEKNKRIVSLLQQSQKDLHNLLDSIKKHIVSEVCPVCGTVHSSSGELLSRLDERRGVQPDDLRIALLELEQTQKRVANLTERLAEIRGEMSKTETLIFSAQASMNEALTRKRQFEESARIRGLPPNPAEAIVKTRQNREAITMQLRDTRTAVEATQKSIQELQAQRADLRISREKAQSKIDGLRNQLETTQSVLRAIELEAARRSIPLNLDPSTLGRELEFLDRKAVELTKSNEDVQRMLKVAQREKNECDSELQKVRSQLSESESHLSQLSSLIARYGRVVKAAGLSAEVKQSDISAKRTKLEKNLSEIRALESEVVEYEIALDATQKSASIAKLQQEIDKNRSQSQELSDSVAQVKEWMSVFEEIHDELERVQGKALTGYTKFFGPLASTIQKRLKSFYGFGDIILTPSKGGIDVRVERRNSDAISPSDYMSQSEIQIVMLSLFLSATLTQNWSSFSPILLDDPVTHFDDFNAYSFVDLLRGIVNDPSNEHQLILSTCEEKLFQLVQQKFKGSTAKVGYHLFESIGEKGPKFSTVFN